MALLIIRVINNDDDEANIVANSNFNYNWNSNFNYNPNFDVREV